MKAVTYWDTTLEKNGNIISTFKPYFYNEGAKYKAVFSAKENKLSITQMPKGLILTLGAMCTDSCECMILVFASDKKQSSEYVKFKNWMKSAYEDKRRVIDKYVNWRRCYDRSLHAIRIEEFYNSLSGYEKHLSMEYSVHMFFSFVKEYKIKKMLTDEQSPFVQSLSSSPRKAKCDGCKHISPSKMFCDCDKECEDGDQFESRAEVK